MASFWCSHDLYREFVGISWFHSRRSLLQITKRLVSRFADNNIQCCRLHRKSLTAIYVLQSIKKATWGCILRLVFNPLLAACLNGPKWLKTEVPVAILTFMLGVTSGYLTSVLMILAPMAVSVSEAELSAIAIVVFLARNRVGWWISYC
ncbi:hypothetical protein NC651_039086 [Populus alba x Populus x berolinensis]|nr:hypothetical protein NC651_039086 [Populus alba x Populus x berolinensis]